MRRAFKYRLYPNADQARELETALETHRRLYNLCIEQRKAAWEGGQKSLSYREQRSWFSAARGGHEWYSRLNVHSAEETIRRVDRAYQAFFRRVKQGKKPGYPRFRGRDRYDSIPFGTYPNGLKLVERDGRRYVRVQHVAAAGIRVKYHRELRGEVKTATLKREAGNWYVVFSCDLGDVAVAPSTNPPVGIDVGVERFLTTSDPELDDRGEPTGDGRKVENPHFLRTSLPELRRRQRAVSRKKKGGKNRRKAQKQVRKLHARVKNQRKEFHHRHANELVRRYGVIAAEDLNIRGMLGNRRLSRAISDVAWAAFLGTLRYKAESAGVAYVEVDARGTSQLCSGCGATVAKPLGQRRHDCPACGLSLHRDHNAARNILARAVTGRTDPAGLNPGVAPDVPGNPVPSADLFTHPPAVTRRRGRPARQSGPSKGVPPEPPDAERLTDPYALACNDLPPRRRAARPAAGRKPRGSANPPAQGLLWLEIGEGQRQTAAEGSG